MTWDPEQYHKFTEFRARAGYDLLAQIPMESYQLIYDLGCGTGDLTRLLQRYWVDARIIGIDSSPEMLAQAQQESSSIIWQQHDILTWQPEQAVDLIFSNAALQWLPDHERLLSRLMSYLRPGGVLAIQMSNNFQQASHRNLLIAARSGPWRKILEPLLQQNPVLLPEQYYEILSPLSSEQNIWQTIYYHPLTGENPVLEWVKGTFLKPLLDALTEPERTLFLTDYANRIQAAYPVKQNGITFFPFQRLFMVVKK